MPHSPRRRLLLGLAAAGSALALAACGADETPETDDTAAEDVSAEEQADDTDQASADGEWNTGDIPDELPRLDEDDLPDEEPDSDAPLSDQIAWEAFKDVADMAVVVDEDASWQCPDLEGEEGEEATCTVTYFGEDFDYEVTVEGGGGFLVTYDAELSEGPLVRETAESAVRYYAETEQVRCDMDEVVRTPLDTDDVVQCEADSDGEIVDYSVGVTGFGTLSPERQV